MSLDGNAADDLFRADDAAAERRVAEDAAAEQVEDDVGWLVLVHRDLFDHDLALGVDVLEGRLHDHLGDHVECILEVTIEEARVDRRDFLVGGSVDLGTDRVEELVDLSSRSTCRCP